jgi:hypothetical protein
MFDVRGNGDLGFNVGLRVKLDSFVLGLNSRKALNDINEFAPQETQFQYNLNLGY